MHIQSINSYNPSSKGLYFSKVSNVLFNKEAKYITQEQVKVSERGIRYIEDTAIPQKIKERFMKIPFIQEVSEKFDTFIFFRELAKGHENNLGWGHFSYAKISWADFSRNMAQNRRVDGSSAISIELATDKMFKNLEQKNFSDIA